MPAKGGHRGPRDPAQGPRDPALGPRDSAPGPRDPALGPQGPRPGPQGPSKSQYPAWLPPGPTPGGATCRKARGDPRPNISALGPAGALGVFTSLRVFPICIALHLSTSPLAFLL